MLREVFKETKYKVFSHGTRTVGVLKEALNHLPNQMESDLYGEGDIINGFEHKMANYLGKEKAIFFPSGTMAQQIGVRIWCDHLDNKNLAYHPLSHLEIHEQGAIKVLHGIETHHLGEKNRLISLADLQGMTVLPAVVLFELPQREIGGQLPNFEDLVEMTQYCQSKGVKTHLDGARLFECLPYYQKEAKEICALFDSVYVSFYKGIGGVAGAILAGPESFMGEAKIWKRRHGGDLISLYPYVVAADYYFDLRINQMVKYYGYAKEFAKFFHQLDGVEVVPKVPVTNMFHVHWYRTKAAVEEVLSKVCEIHSLGLSSYVREISPYHCYFEISLGDLYPLIPKATLKEAFNTIKELMNEQDRLPRLDSEMVGLSQNRVVGLLNAVNDLNKKGLMSQEVHHLKVVKKGAVVAEASYEPYEPHMCHDLFSLSKSFTAIAIGMAQGEGCLNSLDPIEKYLKDYFPKSIKHWEVDETQGWERLHRLSIRDLLMMASGHAYDTARVFGESRHWIKSIMNIPLDHDPGTRFLYNTGATYLLSAIIKSATGEELFDYLNKRLFMPMGMKEAKWEMSPEKLSAGGYGLYLNSESIAKFGVLLTQKGVWQGSQLVSESWINEAIQYQIATGEGADNDWGQGYGYQFWRSTHDGYRGDGAFGQFCLCMPKEELVVVLLSAASNTAELLKIVWQYLLDDLSPNIPVKSIEKSNGFQVVQGKRQSNLAIKDVAYTFETNKLGLRRLEFFESEWSMIVTLERFGRLTKQPIIVGYQEWKASSYKEFGNHFTVSASGAWTDSNTFLMNIRYTQEPFAYEMEIDFLDESIEAKLLVNVGFDKQEIATIRGIKEKGMV